MAEPQSNIWKKWLFITVTRYSRRKMGTFSNDKIDFKNSIPHGKITYLGTSSLKVRVDIFIKKRYDNYREKR